jgi:HK97 family phage major capsid protein
MTREEKLKQLLAEAAELEKKSELSEEELKHAEDIATKAETLSAAIEKSKDVAAKLKHLAPADEAHEDEPVGKTIGERFVKSAEMKQFRAAHPHGAESKSTPIDIVVKNLSTKADPAPLNTGANGDLQPTRLPGIDDLTYRQPNTLLDLITTGTTQSPWLQYRQLISVTNNASIVGEAKTTSGTDAAGGLKPLSTLTTKTADAKAFTYADGIEATNQELADDGALSALIDGVLTQNVREDIERVVLNGAGTADEPAGILNTTGVLNQAFVTDPVTSVRKSKTLLQTTSQTTAQAILLNPEDDEALDLLKDTTGRFFGAGPFNAGPTSLWGVPRVVSTVLPVGIAIIGDFSQVQLLIYEALSILVFNQHKDYAQRNLSYVRAELRALQLIRQPAKLAIVHLAAGA